MTSPSQRRRRARRALARARNKRDQIQTSSVDRQQARVAREANTVTRLDRELPELYDEYTLNRQEIVRSGLVEPRPYRGQTWRAR